jgi:hypothetical protein
MCAGRVRVCLSFLAGVLFLGLVGADARAQVSDAALKDRVQQLLERLNSSKMEAQQAAEDALVKLGPRILPLLPETAKATSPGVKERLERIRKALGEVEDQANLSASKVTIQGQGIRLTEAIQKLQAQSGNAVTDLREQMGAEATNPALDLEIADKPFFEALDLVARQAGVTPYFATGDGTVGLMAGAPPAQAPAPAAPLVQYSGPFRVALKQFTSVRDYQAGTSSANAQFEVAWEPRLRPMLLALDTDALVIADDRGQPVEAQVMNESTDVVLRPENPAAEINVNLTAPDRAAKRLARLKVKAEVTIPAGVRLFRFPSLARRDVVLKQGDIKVTHEYTEVDEQVWKVNMVLEYPGEGPAFESYRQGLFNNRLWLQKADGSRFEHNGGFSNTASDGGRLGFEYLFVDVPGKPADYQLVYETPSRVLTIPLEFEFKDVPLP